MLFTGYDHMFNSKTVMACIIIQICGRLQNLVRGVNFMPQMFVFGFNECIQIGAFELRIFGTYLAIVPHKRLGSSL